MIAPVLQYGSCGSTVGYVRWDDPNFLDTTQVLNLMDAAPNVVPSVQRLEDYDAEMVTPLREVTALQGWRFRVSVAEVQASNLGVGRGIHVRDFIATPKP